ncbi:hypothetical protein CEUSTIGMA_g9566.t1 [Chlamydomonas eustigma]|uniref:Uncharacterized protein n=1 Tax=Chlamydomonas eustigma TaxID=1157962 RepID=A0A250XGD7_9CHLO|nr:hypothetical protein CEUSTIGMA_g9566.t1 [Chlamydomonas eustigma]|eukprot:GAX82138.1 hypothetical protein CEUSTIGMA_g9566.t1 [Chlamydomonas eustigma]
MVPAQAALVRFVATYRQDTASWTDERVRLTSELIQGALAVKMLSWEKLFCQKLAGMRAGEAVHVAAMNRIRVLNTAMLFIVAPLVSFTAFGTYRLFHTTLSVPTVFYCLSLFQLPRTSMVVGFTLAVQTLTEVLVSIDRIDEFLSTKEPPLPLLLDAADEEKATVVMNGADFDWNQPMGGLSTTASDIRQEVQSSGKEVELGGPVKEGVVSSAGGLTLSGIRFQLKKGELLGICGEVGSGKSSVLAALLGEMLPLHKEEGTEEMMTDTGPLVRGTVGYCQQVPWIVAGTVRENIVFDSSWDEEWYKKVLQACALDADIAMLPAGDATELGERGINLSGGQKARIALARACYCRPAVQLMDDPLSAVDPRVGRTLFQEAIMTIMAGSTRVLVTHQRQYLPKCDRVMVMRGGRCAALGTWEEVSLLDLPELKAGATAAGAAAEVSVDEAADQINRQQAAAAPLLEYTLAVVPPLKAGYSGRAELHSSADDGHAVEDGDTMSAEQSKSEGSLKAAIGLSGQRTFRFLTGRRQKPEVSSARVEQHLEFAETVDEVEAEAEKGCDSNSGSGSLLSDVAHAQSGRLVKAEHRQEGDVSWAVYWLYIRKLGMPSTIAVTILLIGGQAVSVASDWWLSLWSRASNQADLRWVWTYGLLVGLVICVAMPRSYFFFTSTLRASTSIHDICAMRVMRAPLSFFHTNPVGRMLNRFSRDLGVVDDLLPFTSFDALQCAMVVLGAFLLVCIAVPVILPVFLPLILLFYYVRGRYIVASRECKRWEAVTRSPLYAFFTQSIKGLPTIRAYGAGKRFDMDFLGLLSVNNAWCFAIISTARWVGFRLDLICALTLSATALLAVAAEGMVQPQLLGLALTYTMSIMGVMQWFVRQTAEVENNMTSMERLLEYTVLPQEPPIVGEPGALDPPEGWPASGDLKFDMVTATYRPGLPPVLREVTFHLPAGTSCGLVGRTGSGKSSLMLALFRLISVDSGRIILDGVDVATIGLDGLRRQLAIIPQDPVLFSGTIRGNLDPWDTHPDAALWEALEAVQLKVAVQELGGLHARMAEAGDNLSVGQRQLFCLARALLQDARILALDEATASVDRGTDALIQSAVRRFARSRFSCDLNQSDGTTKDTIVSTRDKAAEMPGGRVLLVIAHRIDTIIDMDRILVLGAGQLLEEGSPQVLAAKQGGIFSSMVTASNLIVPTVAV